MTSLTTADITPPQKPKLLDRLRDAIRLRHYSIRTEQAYLQWVRRIAPNFDPKTLSPERFVLPALQQLPDLVLPARLLYAIAAQQEKSASADAALETCRRLAAQHPADLFALKGLLLGAKIAATQGAPETTRELLAAARAHPLATGEWVEQIEARDRARLAGTDGPTRST